MSAGRINQASSTRAAIGGITAVIAVLALVAAGIELLYALIFGNSDHEQIPTTTAHYLSWYALPLIELASSCWAAMEGWNWLRTGSGGIRALAAIALALAAVISWWILVGVLVRA